MTSESSKPQPTVFGAPDQEDIIARIDAVDDDDLGSSFFDSSMLDVENAAVRIFNIGIATSTDAPPATTFASPSATPSPARPATQRPTATIPGSFSDPAVRSAFILGGPSAIRP